ncbi:MAG: efflux RND transporter periplasmic adaptor subunit [Anaerolineae bacterium]|nr:efflux RND transporter periplasmic adaptor subunit [Anaerolineae bacterium]
MSKSTNRKRRRWPWIVGIIAAVIILGGVFVGGRIRDARAQLTEFQTGEKVVAFVGDLASTATASGRVVPQRDATLAMATSGRVADVLVEVGDVVQQGDILVQLETAALQRSVDTAAQNLVIAEAALEKLLDGATAADIASAQAAVNSAQAALDSAMNGATPQQIAASEANVRAAQANLNAAYANYQSATEGPSDADLISAESNLQAAADRQLAAQRAHEAVLTCTVIDLPGGGTREFCAEDEQIELAEANAIAANAELAAAQAQYDAVVSGAAQGAINAASGSIAAAQANLEAAQANHELLLQGSTPAQIASAEAQLAQAQATLENVLNGVSAEQITIAEAQVEQARIALQSAENNLAKATLAAPFDGIVTAVYVTEGEAAAGPVIALIDRDSMEVVLSVDEVDLATLELGQEAIVTLEAFPDVEIDSAVIAIAPVSQPGESGLVSYDVNLTLIETDLPLRVNMTANAQLITSDRENVLLVPNAAITADRTTGKYYVNRVAEDERLGFEQVEVTVGLRDNRNTEITSGLSAGDELIVGTLDLTGPFGGPGPGGGPGGRGPFGGG